MTHAIIFSTIKKLLFHVQGKLGGKILTQKMAKEVLKKYSCDKMKEVAFRTTSFAVFGFHHLLPTRDDNLVVIEISKDITFILSHSGK